MTVDSQLLAKVRADYEAAQQSHVFTFYDTLSTSEQSSLLEQLASIDVHRVNRIYANAIAADSPAPPSGSSEPAGEHLGVGGSDANLLAHSRTPSPSPFDLGEWEPLKDEDCATVINNPAEEAQWREAGLKAIADNSVAVLLLAGGQGTRLGSSLPKGMYDIGLPSKSSLFALQAGRINKLARLAEAAAGKKEGDVRIRWYVMTSGPTRPDTEKYFKEQSYFGLDPENVTFFEQGESPSAFQVQCLCGAILQGSADV